MACSCFRKRCEVNNITDEWNMKVVIIICSRPALSSGRSDFSRF